MMELRQVGRRFGTTTVLEDVSLTVPEGSFTSLLGPSGCGKSTTLRIMAGLDRPSAGQVLLNGEDVADRTAAERNVAMVFQSYALYPHYTVEENIALPIAMRDLSRIERLPFAASLSRSTKDKRTEVRKRVEQVAAMLGLLPYLGRKPAELSGGQKQRVALARALVRDPVIFLLDEPLSNLDAKLRVQMRGELTDLHRATGKPFVYVTHDQAEAMAMSDQIVVLMGGRVAQIGPPRALYDRPATVEVAGFVGSHEMNLIDLSQRGGEFGGRMLGLATLGIRPEDVAPAELGNLAARLARVEYLGLETLLHLTLDDGTPFRSLAPRGYTPPPVGDLVRLSVQEERLHLFDSETGRRLPLLPIRAAG